MREATDGIQDYLKAIGRLSLLKPEEEVKLGKAVQKLMACLVSFILLPYQLTLASSEIPPAESSLEFDLPLPPLGEPYLYLPQFQPTNSENQDYLLLDLSERIVYIYYGKKVRASYPIAIGKKGWETPTGTFQIINMEYNPVWKNPITGEIISPGGDNPLGVAWIAFWMDNQRQIGFHGTPKPELIGQAVSHGCVRMSNQDILKLYDWVRIGMTVKVVP